MRIKLRNNPKGKSKNELFIKAIEFYFDKLLGNEVKNLGLITVTFRQMAMGVGGNARHKLRDDRNYKINVCKYSTVKEILVTLAHECCHVKQYFLKELLTKYEYKWYRNKGYVRKRVRIWKGKEIRRSIYKKRPWEVEARQTEKLAKEFLKRNSIQPEKTEILKTYNSEVENIVYTTLGQGDWLNGDFIASILSVMPDKQKRIQAQKEIFKLKQDGKIKEYNINGLVWVGLVK